MLPEPPGSQAAHHDQDQEADADADGKNCGRGTNKTTSAFRNVRQAPPTPPPTGLVAGNDCIGKLLIFEEEDGFGVGDARDGSVGGRFRFRHSVLDEGVHFFTSSSPALHLRIN